MAANFARYDTGRACIRAGLRACVYAYVHVCIPSRCSSSSCLRHYLTLGISLHLLIAYLRQKVQGRSFCQEYSE